MYFREIKRVLEGNQLNVLFLFAFFFKQMSIIIVVLPCLTLSFDCQDLKLTLALIFKEPMKRKKLFSLIKD